MNQKSLFATLLVISAVVATPATVFSADEQNVSSSKVPNFSGFWGRNVFNFEPGHEGPQPLKNLRRTGADADKPIIVGDPVPLVGDFNNPLLRPEAAAILKKRGEISVSGHDFPDPSNQCATFSPPYLFTIQLGMQILQTPKEILFLYPQDDQVRHIRLDTNHPHNLMPTAMGDSVGHYERDTLVVDTVGVKSGPYTMVDRFGTPQSDQMHVVERYHLISATDATDALEQQAKTAGCVCAGPNDSPSFPIDSSSDKGLRIELRIEDPKIFTTAWSANVTYLHVRRTWAESVCAENNTDVLRQGFEHIPMAAKPDF